MRWQITRDGKNITLNDITNRTYLRKIYEQTTLSINFKSNKQPKGYSYWSVMKLGWTSFKEDLNVYNGQVLTEGLIGDIIKKISTFFSKMWKKIYEFISKSFQNFLNFFGFIPNVQFNNSINF